MASDSRSISRLAVLAMAFGGLLVGVMWGTANRPPASGAQAHDTAPVLGRSSEYDFSAPVPGSYRLPPIKPASDARVLDSDGSEFSLAESFDGRITVLSFIYTRCSDPRGCPLTIGMLHQLAWAAARDPELAESGLQLLSLSFDPAHDTPEVMRAYGEAVHHGNDADWRFLTTESQAILEPILRAYDQPIGVKGDPADPFGPYYHQLRVFLIDGEGWIRNIYSLGFLDPRLVLADIRTLLLDNKAQL